MVCRAELSACNYKIGAGVRLLLPGQQANRGAGEEGPGIDNDNGQILTIRLWLFVMAEVVRKQLILDP